MDRKILTGLTSEEYEHSFDRKALNALEATPGLERFTRFFNKNWNDKLLKIQYTGSNLKINENNFKELHNMLVEVCKTLSVDEVPDFYMQWDYSLNAFTAGTEKPIVVINSGCVDMLSYEEVLYIIGHEVGHIKSKHVLYHQMATVLPYIGSIVGAMTLGIGDLLSKGIQLAILNWARMSEFTADRAGLLACQDPSAANRALIKIAGVPLKYFDLINVDEFIKQAREFQGYDYDSMDKIAKVFSIMNMSHPWTVMRTAELITWVESGEYSNIINKYNGGIINSTQSSNIVKNTENKLPIQETVGVKITANGIFCSKCGVRLKGDETICPVCKQKLKSGGN